MSTHALSTGLLTFTLALTAPAVQAAEFTVQDLMPPGSTLKCFVEALSSDAVSSAAGSCFNHHMTVRPFRFSQGALEDLTVGSGLADPAGNADAISPDGTRTAGWMSERNASVKRLFVRDAEGVHLYDMPGGATIWSVHGINDLGQVVGYVGAPYWNGFVLDQGVFTMVQDSDHLSAINNQGLAVGASQGVKTRGLLWRDGTSRLKKSGKTLWFNAVNSQGSVTGAYHPGRKQMPPKHGTRAIVFHHGQMIDLDPTSTTRCSAGRGISGTGQVVGVMETCNVRSTAQPFFHDGTEMLALDGLVTASDHTMWTVTQALAINESGVILATATRDEGGRHPKEHPVLLRPVPTH